MKSLKGYEQRRPRNASQAKGTCSTTAAAGSSKQTTGQWQSNLDLAHAATMAGYKRAQTGDAQAPTPIPLAMLPCHAMPADTKYSDEGGDSPNRKEAFLSLVGIQVKIETYCAAQ